MSRILFLVLATLTLTTTARHCHQGSLSIDGQCIKCGYIPGCAKYERDGKCQICQYGYKNHDGRCKYVQSPQNDCCSLFDDDGNCIKCAPGLVLQRNSCYEVFRPGCLQGEGNYCQNCAADYNNINGKCVRKIENCQIYTEEGTCEQCQQNYVEVLGLCIKIYHPPVVSDCEVQNQYGCVECLEGFYLTRDRYCRQYEKGCLKYFQEQCLFCENAYHLIEGKCLIEGCQEYNSNGCRSCRSPYINSNGKCIIENCYQTIDGVCRICDEEYRLQNGVCVKSSHQKCQGCSNGFIIGVDGNCIKQIPRCAAYDTTGLCSKCVGSFILNKNQCIIPNCQIYGQDGCRKCSQRFIVQNGLCTIQYCQVYNRRFTQCQVCQPGYHLENNKCVLNDPKCQNYERSKTGNQICTQCYLGYILNQNYLCEVRIPGCVYQYGKCISCAYPFKKSGNKCVIDGCREYSFDGCQHCTLPFEAIRGNCVIPYCQEVDNEKCRRCESSYHVVQGRCLKNDPKCSAYKDNICKGCISGYDFVDGVCVRYIPHCKILGRNSCKQCDYGYQLSYGGDCITTDEKCIKFNKFGCQQCRDGFHTLNGLCKIDDPNCIDYSGKSNDQYCETCRKGYIFSENGRFCIRQEPGCIYQGGICSSCKNPFEYDSKQNKCIIKGCVKYSERGCYSCQYPFENNKGQCIILFCQDYDWQQGICSTCQPGYKQIQGRCYRQDPKCVEYSQNGQCKLCITQHIVYEGLCVKEDKNCLKYSKHGGCNKCAENYYNSVDSICLPEKPGCIYQKGVCSMCRHPFNFHEISQTCRIDGCLQTVHSGCYNCKFPFQITNSGICQIPHCTSVKDNACVRCTPGYHLKEGLYCVQDDPSCLRYNEDGDCQICARGYLLMSSGQCQVAEDNCVKQTQNGKCLACKPEYFLNKYYQCQKRDQQCVEYQNGVCSYCQKRYFLYDYICFPYTPGCVKYSGKDCISCRSGWTMRNGQCFKLKKQKLKIEGQDDQYDFEITPIDITKSKYHIDNLSPISKLGKIFFSSFYSDKYTSTQVGIDETGIALSQGWKAEHERSGQYIGFFIQEGEPVTFYALQIEAVQRFYVKEFYIEYSVDGTQFIRIQKSFDGSHSSKDLMTIYFTAIYAKAIRIVIKSYVGWPATKIQFFYFDALRFRKITNLKSLTYLKESIQANFVDRVDNQIYINQRFYFRPNNICSNDNKQICFSGFQLCQPRTFNSFSVYCKQGHVDKIYVTYSIDGQSFNCFEKCRQIEVQENELISLDNLLAKNIRIYPVVWQGDVEMKVQYDYE